MAIDVYVSTQLHETEEHVLHLSDEELDALQIPFREFTRRTGRDIDPYGRTLFPPGTLPPLLDVLRESSNHESASPVVARLLAVLAAGDSKKMGMVFEGD